MEQVVDILQLLHHQTGLLVIMIILFLFVPLYLFSQEETSSGFFMGANYFYGTIVRHNKDIAHLVTDHPQGFILGNNKKTFGSRIVEIPCPPFQFIVKGKELFLGNAHLLQ